MKELFYIEFNLFFKKLARLLNVFEVEISLNFPIILHFTCCANFVSHDVLYSQHMN